MDRSKEFRVLIASDGSLSATAAVVSAQRFPHRLQLEFAVHY